MTEAVTAPHLRHSSPARKMKSLLTLFILTLAFPLLAEDRLELSAGNQQVNFEFLPVPLELADATTFEITFTLDPSTTEGGNMQAVSAIAIGVNPDKPLLRDPDADQVEIDLREGSGRGFFEIWNGNKNLTMEKPDPFPPGWMDQKEYQMPHVFLQREGAYPVKLIVTPEGNGSLLRVYFDHFDRTVAEHSLGHSFTPKNLTFFSTLGGGDITSNTAVLSNFQIREIPEEAAQADREPWETILRGLNYSIPELKPVADAIRKGNMDNARTMFLRHMRTRNRPAGPDIEAEEMHPDYKEITRAALKGEYGTTGWFAGIAPGWTDAAGEYHSWVNEDGTVNWKRCNGHLNRHFHWVAMAKVYHENDDADIAKRFAFEVHDWVTREPFFWDRSPSVGNLNTMDGTSFKLGYMNTSNIGRRCELTWWPAYEVFRKSADFNDEAHFAMLLGIVRQSRLLMNPTSFAAHDDGGAHGTMALLQSALMFPEFKESTAWRKEAERRWDEMIAVQFYPDGAHVSGSTGYNWASINAVENYINLLKRFDVEAPPSALEALARGLDHPMGISRPDHGQIDMNDGGWGMVDTYYLKAYEKYFPDREDFLWMGTSGKNGTPPDYLSKYYPNAGHFVMRTGWGEKEKYAFMDAGPLGASHGKNDKLNFYLALGPHQLISSGGRGSYDANPFSAYASSTYSYNTIIADDHPQQRLHLKHTHTGHKPEERRWITNEEFDYSEGFYRAGWHGTEGNVQGVHTRQILFIKGAEPPKTSYWVMFDTIDPADEEDHEYKALFHSRRNSVEIDEERLSWEGHDASAAYRILPGTAVGLSLTCVRGQMEPYYQGWHVVNTNHAPMNVAEFAWTSSETATRAWIIEAALDRDKWSVQEVRQEEIAPGQLELVITHKGGRKDYILRRPTAIDGTAELGGVSIQGDVAVVSLDEGGEVTGKLEVTPINP